MRQSLPILSALLIGTGLLIVEAQSLPAQSPHGVAPRPQQTAAAPPSPAVGGRPWYALPKLPNLPWSNSQTAVAPSASSKKGSAPGSNSNIESQAAFARLAERRGQTGHAESVYREMLQQDSTLVQPHHRLGVIEAKKGNFDAANTHFQIALMRAPKNVELLVDAGYCLYLQSRLEEAEEVYSTAFRIDPDHESLCNNLGLLFGEQRRFEEALAAFKRCNPPAEAHANLAFVMAQLGDVELAERNFHAALSQNPKLRSAAIALVQLEKAKQTQAIAMRATTPPAAAPVVPATATESPAPMPLMPPSPQEVALLPSQSASPPSTPLPLQTRADHVAQLPSQPASPPSTPLPLQTRVDHVTQLPNQPAGSPSTPIPMQIAADDTALLPSEPASPPSGPISMPIALDDMPLLSPQGARTSPDAWNPEFVTNVAFQPQASRPSSARAVVEDELPPAEAFAATGYWQGPPSFDAAKRADVVVGGHKTVGDMADVYPIRYAGRIDAEAASPVASALDTLPKIGRGGQLPTRPGSGSAVVEDIELAPGRFVAERPTSPQQSGVPTELPPTHRIAPPMPEMPSAAAPQPVLPVSGSHYNLSPHAQPWSSPNASREIGDRSYTKTPSATDRNVHPTLPGGTPPQQQLPTGPNSQTTYRR
jgi:Flp pilus assembly protein TadD